MARLVKYNNGGQWEYALLAENKDDAGKDQLVRLNVPVGDEVSASRATEMSSAGGGEYVVVAGQ